MKHSLRTGRKIGSNATKNRVRLWFEMTVSTSITTITTTVTLTAEGNFKKIVEKSRKIILF